MDVPINYIAVVVAAVWTMMCGTFWYGPIFGKVWIAMMKFTPESIEEAKKKGMGKTYALALVGSLLTSYVMAHSLVFASTYTQTSGATAGLMVGFWSWLGFVVPVLLGTVLWEGRAWKLWALNAGYYFVSFLGVGVILALLK